METALSKGTTLQKGKYTIVKSLGQGSFGITYLATTKLTMMGKLGQMDTTVNVAIKEFFMSEMNSRSKDGSSIEGSSGSLFSNYRQKFKKEAENLSKLDHPNIVNVLDVFDENNTTYYVMQYIDGQSLDDYILQQNGIKESKAISILKEIGKAVQYMHSNKMLHLDLKPKNVMLDKDGKVYLIDFGLSKQYDSKGEPESSTKVGAGTPGYAPIEQANYREGKGFPVTMDVYALGATMFKMLTGVRPPEASDILNDGFPLYELQEHNVSESISACIAKAMAPIKKDRCQTVAVFMYSLENEEGAIIDFDIANKEGSHKKKDIVADFLIHTNTSRVKIEYSPMTPITTGRYIVTINSNSVNLCSFEESTHTSYPFDKFRYNKFLSDLQNLNLSVKEENTYKPFEFSEEPEKLVISLYDNKGNVYAKYWIGGWKNEYGNIDGDIQVLNETIQKITPNLHDFIYSIYKQDYENKQNKNSKVNNVSNNPELIVDSTILSSSKANPGLEFEIAVLTVRGYAQSENSRCLGWDNKQNGCVFVVSEGHQRNNMGSPASNLAVRSIIEHIEANSTESPTAAIRDSIGKAHDDLYHNDFRATCAVTLIKNDKIYFGQVGKNPIYYFTNKGLTRLAEGDNNQMGETMLLPCVSNKPIMPVKNGILLLCTEGFTKVLNDSEISQILSSKNSSLSEKLTKLRKLTLEKGGNDNITTIAIRFLEVNKGVEANKEEVSIRYRWGFALAALVIEAGFAWFMLTQSREGDMDSDGRLLAGIFFFASLCCTYYLFHARKSIAAVAWQAITILFTIACFANSLMLPIWNHSLTGAYFILSLGLSIVSSFTLLIKKSA